MKSHLSTPATSSGKSILFGFLLIALLLLIYFFPYLKAINNTLFAASGDGLKNFYTLAYYVKYDSGVWFNGMLYPYGEHVTFTDNQPLLAFALNFIQHHLFDVTPWLPGIVNGLMFLNFFVCAFFVFKILRHFRLPGTYSVLCSVFITFVAPNIQRLTGHYSLSYSFIIPLLIFLILKYESEESNKKHLIAGAMALTAFLAGMLHPYWALLASILVTTYALVKFLREKKLPVSLFAAGISGVILFKIFLALTDPVVDRPQDPWGAKAYSAWFSSVFFPQYPFYDGLRKALKIKQADLEATAFVGIPGLLFILILAWRFLKSSKRKVRRFRFFAAGPRPLQYLLISGLLILAFSMFIPFRFGMEDFFYKIPFLNQFRSLGRFAWAFYFIFCIYYSNLFWMMLRKIRMSKGVAVFGIAAIALFGVWFTDVHFTFSKVKASIREYGGNNTLYENKKLAELLASAGYAPSDFQAIFPLPIVAEGSEKLWLSGGWLSKWAAVGYSFQTGTPMLGCIMSRTSISHTLNLTALTGSDFTEKKIIRDFKSELPVLVVAQSDDTVQNNILKKSARLADNGELALYRLSLESLRAIRSVNHFQMDSVRNHYHFRKNYFTQDSSENNYYWINHNMERDLSAKDAKPETIERYQFEVSATGSQRRYSLSCWLKVTPFGNKMPHFIIKEYDLNGTQLRETFLPTDRSNSYEVIENWVRVNYNFDLHSQTEKAVVELNGKNSIADYVLFRPVIATVVMFPEKIPGRVYINNYFVAVDSSR